MRMAGRNPLAAALIGTPYTGVDYANLQFTPGPAGPPTKASRLEQLRSVITSPPVINTNDVTSQKTNGKNVIDRRVRPLNNKWMDGTLAFQLLAEYKEMSDPKGYDAYIRGLSSFQNNMRSYSMFSLPTLNYMLHLQEKIPSDRKAVRTAAEVWKPLHFVGTVVSEEGGLDFETNSEEGKQRQFEMAVDGSAETFNIWGPRITVGTNLYLILKQVPSDGCYTLLAKSYTSGSTERVEMGTKIGKKPFKWIPWADTRYDSPPDKELMYEDHFKVLRRGICVRVGKVLEVPEFSPVFYQNKTRSSEEEHFYLTDHIDKIVLQPKITVLLGGL